MGELFLSIDDIKQLMAEVEKQKIESVEIKQNDFEIKITSKCPQSQPVITNYLPSANSSEVLPQPKAVEPVSAIEQPSGTTINSPIVGTFYQSSAPDKPPYINVGDSVKVGDILFIVESMKLMNEVVCEQAGIIKEILVKDGEPIEFGQPVLLIE